MGYRLALDQYAVVLDEKAVVLDVRADRYRLLGASGAAALRALEAGESSHPFYERLRSSGILQRGASGILANSPLPPTGSALERPASDGVDLRFRTVAGAVLSSMAELRWTGLKSTLRRASQRSIGESPDQDRLTPIAQAYARLRSRLPLHQICLADSLALHRIVTARGLGSAVVIGVRLDPFMAHCWLQAGDLVLNDSCDHVSGFTPILRL